jgi:Zn-dependent protease
MASSTTNTNRDGSGSSSKGGLTVDVDGYRFVVRAWAALLVLIVASLYPFADDWVGRALFTVVVFASVVAHELAHATVARRRGLHVSVIRFNALGGFTVVDDFDTAGPRTRLLVAGAGPVVSIVCGVLAVVLMIPIGVLTRPDERPMYVPAAVFAANIVLAILNLLPFSPFDGGHLATAALELATGSRRRAQTMVAIAGITAAAAGAVWLVVRSYTLNTFEPGLIGAVALVGFCSALLLRRPDEPTGDDHEPVAPATESEA